MAYRVFLSHSMSADDEHIVRAAVASALLEGVEWYLAERDPKFGESLHKKIEAAIRSSHCMVLLWTKGGSDSRWINQEVGLARGLNKLIVPVIEKGIQPASVLGDAEYIELDRVNPVPAVERLHAYLTHLRRQQQQRDELLMAGGALAIAIVLIYLSTKGGGLPPLV
jgi:hypothetical protein